VEALFTTGTNVNFDPARLQELILKAANIRDKAKKLYEDASKKAGKTPEKLDGPATWIPGKDIAGLLKQGEEIGILKRKESLGDDVVGLQELLTYGLKGTAAEKLDAMRAAGVIAVDDPSAIGKTTKKLLLSKT